MTAILGWHDGTRGYIATDRRHMSGTEILTDHQEKIVAAGDWLIGSSGPGLIGTVLRNNALGLGDAPGVWELTQRIRALLATVGYEMKPERAGDAGHVNGAFITVHPTGCWLISSEFSPVLQDRPCGIGGGGEYAQGAFYALINQSHPIMFATVDKDLLSEGLQAGQITMVNDARFDIVPLGTLDVEPLMRTAIEVATFYDSTVGGEPDVRHTRTRDHCAVTAGLKREQPLPDLHPRTLWELCSCGGKLTATAGMCKPSPEEELRALWRVRCSSGNCEATGPWGATPEDAIRAWRAFTGTEIGGQPCR